MEPILGSENKILCGNIRFCCIYWISTFGNLGFCRGWESKNGNLTTRERELISDPWELICRGKIQLVILFVSVQAFWPMGLLAN